MQILKIGKELHGKRDHVCKLYRATYDGGRCYAIIHDPSRFTMIFEDTKVYRSLVKKLDKGWTLVCAHRSNGMPFYRLVKGRKSVELTQFIITKYNGLERDAYTDLVVKVFDDARATDNFFDFRRCNAYLPGIDIEHRKDIEYKLRPSPLRGDEKYIYITFKEAENPFTEIVSYERELDEMLRTPKYCYLLYGPYERGNVTVNNGEARCRLSRFVAIYKYHFGDYRGTENGVKNFINDFARINKSIPDDVDADHLNCNRHINTFDNLILVSRTLNRKKWDFINWFAGRYSVHPVLNSKDEILISYERVSLITHEPITRVYKCKTFKDFVDWIMLYLGKDPLTGKLQVVHNSQGKLLTPAGMIASGDMNKDIASDNNVSLTEHLQWRNALLSLPDETFTVHEAREQRDLRYTLDLILDMI